MSLILGLFVSPDRSMTHLLLAQMRCRLGFRGLLLLCPTSPLRRCDPLPCFCTENSLPGYPTRERRRNATATSPQKVSGLLQTRDLMVNGCYQLICDHSGCFLLRGL